MKITNSTGHLTQIEKRAIKAIIENGLNEGRVGRKDYFLSIEGGVYTVTIKEIEIDSYGRRNTRIHKSSFETK